MQDCSKNRRKTYFISGSFQKRFILKFCLLIAGASLLTGFFIYLFNRSTTTVAFEELRIAVKSTSDFILPITLQILTVTAFLAGAAVIFITLFTSHKISGPLYRLCTELEKMKQGDLSRKVKLRADDQIQDLASELDELRIRLKESIDALRENVEPLKKCVEDKDCSMDKQEKKLAVAGLKKIEEELLKFKTD